MLLKRSIRFLPAFTCAWLGITVIVSYSLAVSRGDVNALWPYISDTGTTPPESCIFGGMLSVTSALLGAVIAVRYLQVRRVTRHLHHDDGWRAGAARLLNVLSVVAGTLAAFGAFLVAHFQESSVMTVHLLGANLCFGVGTGYCVLQTAVCFLLFDGRDAKAAATRRINVIRCACCLVNIVTFITTLVFARMAFARFTGTNPLMWTSEEEGFGYRLASTFSEWILAVSFALYVSTFTHEFAGVTCAINMDVASL